MTRIQKRVVEFCLHLRNTRETRVIRSTVGEQYQVFALFKLARLI